MGADRNGSLRRVLALWVRLKDVRYAPTLEVLAGDLGVHPRTVRRDLELLESVGVKLPRWRINKDWTQ